MGASGCRLEVHTQTQFEDTTQPGKTSTKDWNGEAISIQNDGINPLGGTGGVEVKFSATATKIAAEAIFAAHADDDKKADADASIKDALSTLVITETATGFDIRCGHGGSHGTSSAAGSGCKILRVTLPAGSATKAHNLTVGNGNGAVRVGLADDRNSAEVPYVNKLLVDNNGLGAVDIRTNPVKGADYTITGEREVRVALPSTFSAQKVTLTVDESDAVKAAARKITSDFPGLPADGTSFPASGATADAAFSLNVNSKGPFDDDTITISKF
jgi:hypothetical protein